MNKTIKRIEFVLENCEVISIDMDSHKHIDSSIYRLQTSADSQYENFWMNTSCRYAIFCLQKDEYINDFYYSNDGKSSKTPWERLQYRNVTSVVFAFTDDTEQQIYVPYKGEFVNKKMSIKYKKTWGVINKRWCITFDGRNIFEKIRWEIATWPTHLKIGLSNLLGRLKR
jgi:hypothetical protein